MKLTIALLFFASLNSQAPEVAQPLLLSPEACDRAVEERAKAGNRYNKAIKAYMQASEEFNKLSKPSDLKQSTNGPDSTWLTLASGELNYAWTLSEQAKSEANRLCKHYR